MTLAPSARKPASQSRHAPECRCVVCGCESVGKTQLLASLTGRRPVPENFRGSTVACETYRDGNLYWTDTPGILRESETAATRSAIDEIGSADRVMLVARADRAAEQLPALLPATAGKPGFVALTFWDRMNSVDIARADELSKTLGVPVFPIDARRLKEKDVAAIRGAATGFGVEEKCFPEIPPHEFPLVGGFHGFHKSFLERALSHPAIAAFLLFLPAIFSVIYANRLADTFYDPLMDLLETPLNVLSHWPLGEIFLGGDYGLLAMFPFLLLYATPTIIAFSAILAVYKSSGLIDHLSHALHPWLRPFGIGGRDVVRVVMGFGCNVPAIVSSRACHSCSRGACVSAISFGSACSYQLPATLAVFAAAGMAGMGVVYLLILAVTTLIYLRFTTPKVLRLSTNALVSPPANSLTPPSWRAISHEVSGNLKQFFILALPVFAGICFVAAFLDRLGALDFGSRVLSPLLGIFNLPGDAASAIVLGAVRKDGIAIGLLEGTGEGLKVVLTTPAQVLTVVYLAGVLLPCLVTVFTIAREMHWKFAAKLCTRQMLWASGFSLCIAWGGALIY